MLANLEENSKENLTCINFERTPNFNAIIYRPSYLSVLSAGFPPIFKQKIRDKAYNVGDSCTLKVHVIGNPMPILSWYRNEELLSAGGRVRIDRGDDGRHSLTVLQTKPNDFGVYKCVARNKYGTVTCRARMLCGGKLLRDEEIHWLVSLFGFVFRLDYPTENEDQPKGEAIFSFGFSHPSVRIGRVLGC